MHEILAPLEAETVEEDGEYLEVIVLLVAHHIDHLVDGVVVEAHLSGADVLCHIHAGTVGAEQQFLVEALVGEISPHAVVGLAEEESLLKAFLHLVLALEISVRLVVDLVEAHAECLVGLIETSVDPVVHLLPQCADLRISGLPLDEHLVSFHDEWSLVLGFLLSLFLVHALSDELRFQFVALLFIVFVEEHVEVTNEVVALLVCRFGCDAVAPLDPSEHRLHDVYTTVVDDIGLDDFVAVGLHDLGEAPSEQVVAHVSEV